MRRALLGYTLYSMAETAMWLAVVLWAYAEGGAGLAGVVAAVQLAPAAVLTPVLAGVGDGMSRGRALTLAYACCAVAAATATVLVAVDAPVVAVAGAAAVVTLTMSLVRPIHFAALPQLAETPAHLVSGNALSAVAEGLALLAGPLLAGLGAQVAGPWLVFAVATGLRTAALCASLRLGLDAPTDARSGDGGLVGWRRPLRGVSVLWSEAGATLLLLVMSTQFVIDGAIDVLGVSYAQGSLGLGESAAGVLIGAAGIGALVGGAVSARLLSRDRLAPVVLIGGLVHGCAFATVAAIALVGPAAVLIAVTGAGGAVLMVAGRTLLQRTADDRVLAQVFAVQESVGLLGAALGAAVAPLLVDALGDRGAFLPIGVVCALFVVLAVGHVRRLDGSAQLFPEQVTLLRGVSFLAPLAPYDLERLARNAEWVDVAAGDDVIRQGEVGDRFFVVDAGVFSVTVDGVLRPHRLVRGDGFGEIALVKQVPRTATVTAREDGRLLALAAEDFLAAVTGTTDGAAIAQEVTTSHLLRDETTRGRAQSE